MVTAMYLCHGIGTGRAGGYLQEGMTQLRSFQDATEKLMVGLDVEDAADKISSQQVKEVY